MVEEPWQSFTMRGSTCPRRTRLTCLNRLKHKLNLKVQATDKCEPRRASKNLLRKYMFNSSVSLGKSEHRVSWQFRLKAIISQALPSSGARETVCSENNLLIRYFGSRCICMGAAKLATKVARPILAANTPSWRAKHTTLTPDPAVRWRKLPFKTRSPRKTLNISPPHEIRFIEKWSILKRGGDRMGGGREYFPVSRCMHAWLQMTQEPFPASLSKKKCISVDTSNSRTDAFYELASCLNLAWTGFFVFYQPRSERCTRNYCIGVIVSGSNASDMSNATVQYHFERMI